MASKNKVLQQKCPPRTKNYDYGVIVAWIFFSAEISGRAQESAISVLSEYLVLSTQYSVLSTKY